MNNKKQVIITYAVLVICSILFVSLIFNRNVWLDEAFTASLVHTNFADVISRSMADTLPPLYNILLKLSTDIFGYAIPVMKMTSVVPMILTMLLGATVVRKRFGFKAGLTFIICITVMPLMFCYGIEIRMYSLGFLFATASGIFAYEVVCDSTFKNWCLFTVASVLAGYSHHFAFVAVGFVYLFLLLYYFFADRKHLKRWFICLAATFILYLPCLIVTLKQLKSVSGYFSMPEVTFPLFIQYVIYPFMTGVTPISLILFLTILLLLAKCVYSIIKKRDDMHRNIYSLLCFFVYYGVLIFGTVISRLMTANIFVDRYLFFSVGLLWLFFSVQFGAVSINLQNILITLVIISSGICTYREQFRLEYGNSADEEIAFISSNITDDDVLYTVEDYEEFQFIIPFYYMLCGHDELRYAPSIDDALKSAKSSSLGTVWIAVKDGFELPDSDIKALALEGLTPEYVTTFEFDRYICDIYKVVR